MLQPLLHVVATPALRIAEHRVCRLQRGEALERLLRVDAVAVRCVRMVAHRQQPVLLPQLRLGEVPWHAEHRVMRGREVDASRDGAHHLGARARRPAHPLLDGASRREAP